MDKTLCFNFEDEKNKTFFPFSWRPDIKRNMEVSCARWVRAGGEDGEATCQGKFLPGF